MQSNSRALLSAGLIFLSSTFWAATQVLQGSGLRLTPFSMSSLSEPKRAVANLEPVDESVNACIQQSLARGARLSGLPRPSSMSNLEFQKVFYSFLRSGAYRKSKWVGDKRVRDTGDFSKGAFNGNDTNGTHPSVIVYYSPEVYCWMLSGRRGALPDGSAIIKEMYPPPAARYQGKKVEDLIPPWWTTMIKDSQATKDGWYWGSVFDEINERGERTVLQPPDEMHPENYPESGFGSYCVNCHASANKEFTFSSLHNVEKDFDPFTGKIREFGTPIFFRVDNSWKTAASSTDVNSPSTAQYLKHSPHLVRLFMNHQRKTASETNSANPAAERPKFGPDFTSISNSKNHPLLQATKENILRFPQESFDRAPQTPQGQQYITSDQCMGCHAGDNGSRAVNMFLQGKGFEGNGIDVSPWGEWRWSMMGLSGRDPVFHAQLETELTKFKGAQGPFKPEVIADTCLKCHGVMGHQQFHLDKGKPGGPPANALFSLENLYKKDKYGALARDGISCTVCHQMKDNSKQTLKSFMTGNFQVEPITNGFNTILGPYHDPKSVPMETALGMIPKVSPFLSSSRVCASCHTVHLPALNANGEVKKSGFEQSTYLEWLNSEYADGKSTTRSCQNCHMPDQYAGKNDKNFIPLSFKIANIQDTDFPFGDHQGEKLQADHLRPPEEIALEKRSPFRRHTLYGINIFALELFNQFSDVLGRRKSNYWNSLETGAETAIENGVLFAQRDTARVEILSATRTGQQLSVKVRVKNLTGHRFPSGVGFRRAFLELGVREGERYLFRSGATDQRGVIIDRTGKALPSEFFQDGKFERHYQVITNENQVQIYQELVQDEDHQFTTSFFSIFHHVKDNRLLPKGWKRAPSSVDGVDPAFFKATWPIGEADQDADFTSGQGEDIVEYRIALPNGVSPRTPLDVHARLYYQSIPPYYLNQRFKTASGPATQRLYYLTSRLKTQGTAIENWKLLIHGADEKVK